MLSTILWILAGIIGAWILYWIGVFVFTIAGIKKIFDFARHEVNALPNDYTQMRKEVKNENASKGAENFIKTIFVRWYHKLFK